MIIHQTLHGYFNGHRQIAGSIDLPRKSQNLVTSQSDYSGRSMFVDFDGYLTGYPLPEIQLYAIARTWYARDNRRPGCVWTHTAYLGSTELAAISPSDIKGLFIRPSSDLDLIGYEVPLRREFAGGSWGIESERAKKNFNSIARHLFDDAGSPVVVAASSAEEMEDVAIALWLAQWPKLRMIFTFSTGSLSNRKYQDKSFDLQIVPKKDIRQFLRTERDAKLVDPEDDYMSQFENVIELALIEKRNHFWQIGENCPPNRRLVPIAAMSAMLSDVNDVYDADTLLESFEAVFPKRKDEQAKQLLINELLNGETEFPFGVPRRSLAKALTSRKYAIFGEEMQHVARLAAIAFAKASPSLATEFLLAITSRDISTMGVAIADGLLEGLDIASIQDLVASLDDELPILVSFAPKICSYKEVWKGTRRQQYEILDALSHAEIEVDLRDSIVRAILAANAHWLAGAALRALGEDVVIVALRWYGLGESGDYEEPSANWIAELRARRDLVVEWLLINSASLTLPMVALISRVLDPEELAQQLHAGSLLISLDRPGRYTPFVTIERATAFLFAVALKSTAKEAASLASRTFERLHETLMNRELGFEEWSWLSPELPSLGWAWNWDRAERLRQGTVERFVLNDWPITEFASCVKSQETWALLVKSASETASGTVLIAKLFDAIRSGTLSLGDDKLSVLRQL